MVEESTTEEEEGGAGTTAEDEGGDLPIPPAARVLSSPTGMGMA